MPITMHRKDYVNSLLKLNNIARQGKDQHLAGIMFGKPIHSIYITKKWDE